MESEDSSEAQLNTDLAALDEAPTRFASEYPGKAELIKLGYFAALTVEDAARCLDISQATADRRWSFARAWLYERMTRGDLDS